MTLLINFLDEKFKGYINSNDFKEILAVIKKYTDKLRKVCNG